MARLKISRLIKSDDQNAHRLGLEIASYIMEFCSTVLPQEIVGGDKNTYAVLLRFNEMKQWGMLRHFSKFKTEASQRLEQLELWFTQLHKILEEKKKLYNSHA